MTTYIFEVILTDFDIDCIQAAMKFSKSYYDLSEKINFLMSKRRYYYGYLDDINKVSNKLDIIRLNKKEEYEIVFNEHEYFVIHECFDDASNESFHQYYELHHNLLTSKRWRLFHNLLEHEEWNLHLNKDLTMSELKPIFNSIKSKIEAGSELNSYSNFTKKSD
jgi:hypothetical protein